MKLNLESLKDRGVWEEAGIQLPMFDIEAMREKTKAQPAWVHFGAGNIFRAFPCAALQRLLDEGLYDRGVIACETYDPEIVDAVYTPYDNLSLLAVLRADGRIERRVIASVAESLKTDEAGLERLTQCFENPSLQMASLTVTEKAYVPTNPMVDLLCTLLWKRFLACGLPLAMVSMDNCSHNGEKLRNAMLQVVEQRASKGEFSGDFLSFMKEKVAFPITMIDKITPHPDADVAKMLCGIGFEDADIVKTAKGNVTAVFVNAEQAEYLVIEDQFPNGRPPLEEAGILFTDRETVDKVEKMKVGTCLNPLHTAIAILGCLLGYNKVSNEMSDEDILRFVEKLGYGESLPVVEDPGIISPKAFLDEVLKSRLRNPFLPDTPQRIAADTSQKLSIRFGWTLSATRDKSKLVCVPFVFAAWLRYLSGVDDQGDSFVPSPDPRLQEVRERMQQGISDELLSDASLFGANLVEIGLAQKVRDFYDEMNEGNGAVRKALHRVVSI